MRFVSPEVIIQHDDLSRRFLRFYFIDSEMVLDRDEDQSRQTKRHKWQVKEKWSRLDGRNNTIERREVPQSAIEDALQQGRESLTYRDDLNA